MNMTEIKRSKRIHVLRRYKAILDEFNKYDSRVIPITVIHREYIYPKYFISRETLYKIFNTPIDEELAELQNKTPQLRG